jgi:hypothetical protein
MTIRRIALIVGACFLASSCVMPEVPGRDAGGDVYVPLPDAMVQCRGNNDGVIDRSEVVFVPGAEASYRVNPAGVGVIVDTMGAMGAGGARVWDFTQYAARLDPREATLGVYRATDTALELLGAVGEAESSRTMLRYDNPVALLRFPLRMGDAWTSTAMTVEGMVDGTPVASRDTYALTVDARGEVRLGALTFRDALRLRIETTQVFPAGPGRRRIQYLWMTECYGEVARITSMDGQVATEFTTAREFRRLGF